MSDIVERLRWCGKELADHYSHAAIFDEAADAIERLRKEHPDSGEPVAWRCVADDGVSDLTEDEGVAEQWRSDGFAVTPLYAAPGPAEDEIERLRELYKAARMREANNRAPSSVRSDALEEAARVAEKEARRLKPDIVMQHKDIRA